MMMDLSNHFDLILVQMMEELTMTMYLLVMHPLRLVSQEMTTITILLLVMMTMSTTITILLLVMTTMTMTIMKSMTSQVITMTRNPREMTQYLKIIILLPLPLLRTVTLHG